MPNDNKPTSLLLSIGSSDKPFTVIRSGKELNLNPINGYMENVSKTKFYFIGEGGDNPQLKVFDTTTNKLTDLQTPNFENQEFHQVGDTLWGVGYQSSTSVKLNSVNPTDKPKIVINSGITIYTTNPENYGNPQLVNIDLSPSTENYSFNEAIEYLRKAKFLNRYKLKDIMKMMMKKHNIKYEHEYNINNIKSLVGDNDAYIWVDLKVKSNYMISTDNDWENLTLPDKHIGKLIHITKDGKYSVIDGIEAEVLTNGISDMKFEFSDRVGGKLYTYITPAYKGKTIIGFGDIEKQSKYRIEIAGIEEHSPNIYITNDGFLLSVKDNELGLMYNSRLGIPPTLYLSYTTDIPNTIGGGGYLQLGKNLSIYLPHSDVEFDYLVAFKENGKPLQIKVNDENLLEIKRVSNGILIEKEFYDELKETISNKLGVNTNDNIKFFAHQNLVYLIDTEGKKVAVGRITPNFGKSKLVITDKTLRVEPVANFDLPLQQTEEDEFKGFTVENISLIYSDNGNPYLLVKENWTDPTFGTNTKRLQILKIDPQSGKLEHKLTTAEFKGDDIDNITLHEVGDTLTAIILTENGKVWVGDTAQPQTELQIENNVKTYGEIFKPDVNSQVFQSLQLAKANQTKFFQLGKSPIYLEPESKTPYNINRLITSKYMESAFEQIYGKCF